MESGLIERIYECSFVPELWPGVLDDLATLIEARGGSLFIFNGDQTYWSASEINRDRTERAVSEKWLYRGTFAQRLFAGRHAGFFTEEDAFSPGELENEPLYRDFLRPGGIGGGAVTVFSMATNENVVLAVNRVIERGPVERCFIEKLDELRPHLARSILMSGRLQLERARAASETLAGLGLPALVVNHAGRVLTANSLVETYCDFVKWRANDQIALSDKAADRLFREAMASINMTACVSVRSFPVRAPESGQAMVAHVVPVHLSARDIFVRAAAALVLAPVTPQNAPPVELIQSLFDLTPTEARIARSLAAGQSLDEIAKRGAVSINTVRTHLRSVFGKVGIGRQPELVSLLNGISLPRAAASLDPGAAG